MNESNLHNRQMESGRSVQGTIKQKIKSYMASVAIDIFGYEAMVSRSVRNYTVKMGEELGVPPGRIMVRIIENQGLLRVFLLAGGKSIKELTVLELVQFFVGLSGSSAHLEKQVIKSVSRFLKEYAENNAIQPGKLQVLISSSDGQVTVTSFNDHKFMENLQVKFLIQCFKA